MRVRNWLIGAGVLSTAAAALTLASGGSGPGDGEVGPPPPPGPDGPPGGGGQYWPPPGAGIAPAGAPQAPLPAGKGMFVRHVKHGGDPELFAKRCAWMGLRWVMIQAIWQYPAGGGQSTFINKTAEYPEYGAALRAAGVTPWVFGWPRPEAMQQFVDVCRTALDKLGGGPGGIVINPETPWYRRQHANATRLVELLRASFGSLPVGMTSYGGGPPNHPPFPWREFAACDFGLPQIYDTKGNLGPGYPERSVQWWTKAGYRCVPVLAAYPKARTPQMMADIASRTPLPMGAVCWWDLYWLLGAGGGKARTDFVRQYFVPSPEVA